MTTRRPPTEAGPLPGGRFANRPAAGDREVRGVEAEEVLAILAPTSGQPEGLRSMYLWKTDRPAPSVQPSAA